MKSKLFFLPLLLALVGCPAALPNTQPAPKASVATQQAELCFTLKAGEGFRFSEKRVIPDGDRSVTPDVIFLDNSLGAYGIKALGQTKPTAALVGQAILQGGWERGKSDPIAGEFLLVQTMDNLHYLLSVLKKENDQITIAWETATAPSEDGFGYQDQTSVAFSEPTETAGPWPNLTLRLPEGGSLTMAKLAAAPPAPAEGQGFMLESAGGRLEARILSGEPRTVLYVYAVPTGRTAARWLPIPPSTETNGTLTFDLSHEASRYRLMATNRVNFWISRLPRNSTPDQQLTAIENQIHTDIQSWMNAITDPLLKANTQTNLDNAAYRVYPGGNGENYYSVFGRSAYGTVKRPHFGIELPASGQPSSETIAHEVGHYMSHVLMGDANYDRVDRLAPDENHGIGVSYAPRRTITEDYAYFSEFFLTGVINNADPCDARMNWMQRQIGKLPSEVDYPSVEGFGASLLANLHEDNTNAVIKDFAGESAALPALRLTTGEIAKVFSEGNSNINDLRVSLGNAFSGKSYNPLPVVAEALGWSYHGQGRVVDQDNQPVAGATVQARYVVGGETYLTPSATTDEAGYYTLARIFPDSPTIVVTKGEVVNQDTHVLDWNNPTNAAIDLGTRLITIPKTPPSVNYLSRLQGMRTVAVSFQGALQYEGMVNGTQNPTLSTFAIGDSAFSALTWSNNVFSLSKTLEDGDFQSWDSHRTTRTVNGTVSANGTVLESLTVTYVYEHYWGSALKDKLTKRITVHGVPIQTPGAWTNDTFFVSGSAGDVGEIVDTYEVDGTVQSRVTSFSPGSTTELKVTLTP